MTKRDYYEILGISRNASEEEIKRAYRKLAMKHHPDRNPGNQAAEERFKELKEAYEMLSDNKKRAAYNQYGHAGVDPNISHGSAGFSSFSEAFGDIFGDIFGQTNNTNNSSSDSNIHRGTDLQYRIEITLEQAANGYNTKIRVPVWNICDICNGSGSRFGSRSKICSTCHGSGSIRMSQGFFSIQQTCHKCHGSGSYISDPCNNCRGSGKAKKIQDLDIKIPAGIDNGMRIKSVGHGEPGINGGPSGDLYIEVHIKSHSVFERDGDSLHCKIPIPFTIAALGGEIEVPTLAGRVIFRVPDGTQSGKTFRLRGKGLNGLRSSSIGDLYVHIQVETPVKLNEHQRRLLQMFEKSLLEGGSRHNPQRKSWLNRVKSFFE